MKLLPQLIARLRPRPGAPGDPPAETASPLDASEYFPCSNRDWPAEAERRLSYQVLKYWESLRGDRRYPAYGDIDGEVIADLWPWCFVLDTKHDYPTPYFEYLGSDLAKYSGIFLSGEDDWRMSLLDKAAAHLHKTLEAREPLLVEDTLVRFDGRKIVFRSIMMPLSDDNSTITHVFGAANGKLIRAD